jgi:hypothetical protein
MAQAHVPNALLQPAPQYAASDPQYPHSEQHDPKADPRHVAPPCTPQSPLPEMGVEGFEDAVGATLRDEVRVEGFEDAVGAALRDGVGVGTRAVEDGTELLLHVPNLGSQLAPQ